MNKMIYQHFSKNDSSFIDKGVEWIKKVEDSYSPFLSRKDFKGASINQRHLLHEQSAVS